MIYRNRKTQGNRPKVIADTIMIIANISRKYFMEGTEEVQKEGKKVSRV